MTEKDGCTNYQCALLQMVRGKPTHFISSGLFMKGEGDPMSKNYKSINEIEQEIQNLLSQNFTDRQAIYETRNSVFDWFNSNAEMLSAQTR